MTVAHAVVRVVVEMASNVMPVQPRPRVAHAVVMVSLEMETAETSDTSV